jgi:hypothetical protein
MCPASAAPATSAPPPPSVPRWPARWPAGRARRDRARVCRWWKSAPATARWQAACAAPCPGGRRPAARLLLVESSPVLAARQREKLGRAARWFEQPSAALSACGGAALVFANELADAFPPDVLEWRAGAWHEVCLEIAPPARCARPCARPPTRRIGPAPTPPPGPAAAPPKASGSKSSPRSATGWPAGCLACAVAKSSGSTMATIFPPSTTAAARHPARLSPPPAPRGTRCLPPPRPPGHHLRRQLHRPRPLG